MAGIKRIEKCRQTETNPLFKPKKLECGPNKRFGITQIGDSVGKTHQGEAQLECRERGLYEKFVC